MYTLILTIILIGSHHNPAATSVTPVYGFASKADCLAAGNEWMKDVRRSYEARQATLSAVCVKDNGGG